MRKALAVLSAMLLMVGMSAAASTEADLPDASAVPGDLMYSVDTAQEQVNLFMASTFGGNDRAAEVRAEIAEERLAEAQVLVDSNRSEVAQKQIQKYQNQIEKASEQAETEERASVISNSTEKHVEVLEGVKEKVPEEAQQGIQTAIESSQNVAKGLQRKIEAGDFKSENKPDLPKNVDVPGLGGQ